MISGSQPVTITPDDKLLRNLEAFAQEREISTEEAVNVILSDMLRPDTPKPKKVRNDRDRKTQTESTRSEMSVKELRLRSLIHIMVDIAIRIEEKKYAEAAAKEAARAKVDL